MISAGVEGRLPYMTYPERWRGPPKQPPELFLRPAPKPMPPSTRYFDFDKRPSSSSSLSTTTEVIVPSPTNVFLPCSRYNGVATNNNVYQPTNGTRLAPPPARPISKYPSPPSIPTPVNLAQQQHTHNNNNNNIINNKDDMVITSEDNNMASSPYSTYRLFHPHMPHFSYPLTNQLCQQPYLMRANFPPTPLSPMEPFSPTTPPTSSTFLSPTFSPPSALSKPGPGQAYVRDKRTPPHSHQSPLLPQQTQTSVVAFKVPSGKEGSLKHRILTRPEDSCGRSGPLDLQKPPEGRKRLHVASTISSPPPRSPKKTTSTTSLNSNTTSTTATTAEGNFAKGSLIQLHNGELRRIEDMRTEDFVMSAERNPELRLAESTVVRIEEGLNGNATITLTYNQRRAQVDVESTIEHPYFVMGHGWASCNPERTLQCFGLKVHQLQVGDILISVTPRDKCSTNTTTSTTSKAAATTIMTSATTTSMTAKQLSVSMTKTHAGEPTISIQSQPMNLHFTPSHPPQSMSPDSLAARKRRWSAPDQICDDEEQIHVRRHRVE